MDATELFDSYVVAAKNLGFEHTITGGPIRRFVCWRPGFLELSIGDDTFEWCVSGGTARQVESVLRHLTEFREEARRVQKSPPAGWNVLETVASADTYLVTVVHDDGRGCQINIQYDHYRTRATVAALMDISKWIAKETL